MVVNCVSREPHSRREWPGCVWVCGVERRWVVLLDVEVSAYAAWPTQLVAELQRERAQRGVLGVFQQLRVTQTNTSETRSARDGIVLRSQVTSTLLGTLCT